MPGKHDQLNELQKKNLEAAMRLAQLSIENSQRIMQLQVAAAKRLFEEGVENAKALAVAKDPKAMMEMRTSFAQRTTEEMLACAREIAQLTAATQAEFGKLVGVQLSSGSHDMMEAMQKMFAGMPIADQNSLGAVQTAMDTTRSAFEQMMRASQQAFQALTQQPGGRGRR